MFKFAPCAIKSSLTAATLALSVFSMSAQATLTSYNVKNTDLVYSSVSDVTWTKDANLLGTWIASSTDDDRNGTVDIIDAIIAANPIIESLPSFFDGFTGQYKLTANDFSFNGQTSWWGAQAFVYYLGDINYGGTTSWHLPKVANEQFGYNTATNGATKGDELPELFYDELKGTADNNIPDTTTFDNEQAHVYWSETESLQVRGDAWDFRTYDGFQQKSIKTGRFNVWAVSTGQVTSVPEPESLTMLLAGLGVIGATLRRRQKQAV